MLKNYFKTALRNLWRYKGYSAINLLGLAIGLACVMLIILYVRSELSYDRFHEHRDQIYLLTVQTTNPQTGETGNRAIGPYRLAKELQVDFSDFSNIVRFAPQQRESIEYGDKTYQEDNVTFVDDGVFESFTFPLVSGDPETVLLDPYSVVITPGIAQKYFGTDEPIGKVLRIRNADFKVTGIMQEIPEQSQFDFNILISMNCAPQIFSKIVLENWGEGYVWTFVRTPDNKSPADYEDRLQ
ncbi:MAG: ABC transporter permease, partial [Saprospiraceae bacterium]|nr:ABC transporter permease [Saprospiraceae bacterium]